MLIILSGMMSASEVAYFSLTPSEIEKLKKKPNSKGNKILKLLDNPEKLIGTILIANTFVNIGIVIISTWVSTAIFNSYFPRASNLVIFIFQAVVITLIILFFGEIFPKAFATQFRMRTANFMATTITFLSKLLFPITFLLVKSSDVIKQRVQRQTAVSINDLSHAIDLASTELRDDEKLLKGIVNFGNTDVKEIIISRMDVVTVDMKYPFSKVVSIIIESGYSRIPAISNSFDNVKGILYIKDLLPHIHKTEFRWQSLIRPPYFIPETKKINDLLEEFQLKKIHMAVVIDEYGGASGIVTLEDILEEIVGDIDDEFDKENTSFVKISETEYLFEGKTLLNDFYRAVNVADNYFDSIKGEAETLAGLILEIKGSIPQKNELIKIEKINFKIKSVDNRRIKQLIVNLEKDSTT
ncbi:MAG: gliding motility-associated protein GldE [Bacteroidia bacterium]|nr:gliding motility-associated protein GldE [Bacteroidia bacterium]